MKQNFAEFLKYEMETRNLNASQIANRSGLTESAISMILSGKRGAGVKSILRIADALNLPAGYVFAKAGYLTQRPGRNRNRERLIAIVEYAREQEVDFLLDIAGNVLPEYAIQRRAGAKK